MEETKCLPEPGRDPAIDRRCGRGNSCAPDSQAVDSAEAATLDGQQAVTGEIDVVLVTHLDMRHRFPIVIVDIIGVPHGSVGTSSWVAWDSVFRQLSQQRRLPGSLRFPAHRVGGVFLALADWRGPNMFSKRTFGARTYSPGPVRIDSSSIKKRGHWGMPPLTKKEKAAEKLKRLSPQQEKQRRRELLREAMKKDKEQREQRFQLWKAKRATAVTHVAAAPEA